MNILETCESILDFCNYDCITCEGLVKIVRTVMRKFNYTWYTENCPKTNAVIKNIYNAWNKNRRVNGRIGVVDLVDFTSFALFNMYGFYMFTEPDNNTAFNTCRGLMQVLSKEYYEVLQRE